MRYLIALITFACSLSSALAFMPNPDMLTITPSVAKAGTTVEVRIKGDHMEDLETLRFEDPRIVVEPVTRPADEFFPEPQPEKDRFLVTIPEDVEPGIYEVRSKGYFGLSTARPFMVVDKDAKEIEVEGDRFTRDKAIPLEVETGAFGILQSRKIDWFQFKGKKDDRVMMEVWAERLDSKADCQLVVFDESGRELESNSTFFGSDPMVDFTPPADGTYYVAVSDMLYSSRGSEYFYRLKISRDPHVDFVFPPAIPAGKETKVTVYGRNLPGGSLAEGYELEGKAIESIEVTVKPPAKVGPLPGIYPGTTRQGIIPGFSYQVKDSNAVRIGLSEPRLILEDTAKSGPQKINVPCEVAGRFDQPGDADQFRFTAQKGKTYHLEVISERLGVMADSFVSVQKIAVDEEGKETLSTAAENDDPKSFFGPDALDDLNADTLDPSLSFTADQDGDYLLTMINQSASGSPSHLYRLAVREAKPDFQLISGTERTKIINNDAYPAAPVVRRGGSMVFRILALRQDGFDGAIQVEAQGLPEGVTAPPLVLTGNSREGYLTIAAADDAAAWTGPILIVGKAVIGEQEIEREARNGSIIWGTRVFAYQRGVRSRLDSEIVLSVMDTEVEPSKIALAEDKVWEVEEGGSLEFPVRVTDTGTRKGNLQVEVHGFPGLLRGAPKVTVAEKAKEAKLKMDFKPTGSFELEPGRHQFVLQGIGNANYRYNPGAAERTKAEVDRLTQLKGQFAAEQKTQETELASAEKELAALKKEAAAAADDEARGQFEKPLKELEQKIEDTKKAIEASKTKSAQVDKHIASAEKDAKAAEATAKEKTNQFATYSLPITVEVKPKPGKDG